jgi:TonB family protein
MNSNIKQSKPAAFRILLAFPTAFVLLILFSFTNPDKTTSLLDNNIKQTIWKTINLTPSVFTSNGDTPLQNEEDFNAHYPGGYAAWTELVKENTNLNLNIPSNVQGKEFAIIRFLVSENGTVKDPKVLNGMNEAYDKEALRMISLMPKWAPTIIEGKPVSVVYVLPIKLALQNDLQKTDQDEKPLLKVEKNPEFKGGYAAMLKYLQANLHYPASAKTAGIQGTIFVQFVISKTGKISNVKILRGIESTCDEEAVRVVKGMPDWTPGENNGKTVPVMFQIPVKFQLSTSNAGNEEKPYTVVEQNPQYKGGYDAMLKYLSSNLKYPEIAKTNKVQGTVFVSFIIRKTGKVSDPKILRGIGSGCDEEALRVVRSMPDWIPGKQSGKEVAVVFQIPVKFQLSKTTAVVEEGNEEKPLIVVEQNPEYAGGYANMLKYLKDNLKYPESAKNSGIQGTVFVQFVVGKTGALSNVKVLRGIGGGCDEESVRVVKTMPKWIPGRQNGVAVPVMFQIPVRFQLSAKKE